MVSKNKQQMSRGRKDVHQKTWDLHLTSIFLHIKHDLSSCMTHKSCCWQETYRTIEDCWRLQDEGLENQGKIQLKRLVSHTMPSEILFWIAHMTFNGFMILDEMLFPRSSQNGSESIENMMEDVLIQAFIHLRRLTTTPGNTIQLF